MHWPENKQILLCFSFFSAWVRQFTISQSGVISGLWVSANGRYQCRHSRHSRFPLQADGELPVAYLCAIFSLRRLWLASLPPCGTVPRVGRRWLAGWGPLPSPRLLLLLAYGGAPLGLGCGPGVGWGEARSRRRRWGLAADWSTLVVLRSAAEGKSCAFEVGTSESLFTQEGEGEAGPLHKNACVMTGAAERRNALHNPNTVGAGPGLRWQPFLPIYLSSLSTQSLALSVALSIPGKLKNGLRFYLWLDISKYSPVSSPSVDKILKLWIALL